MSATSNFFKVFSPSDWDGITEQLPDSISSKIDTYGSLKEASSGKTVFTQADFDRFRPDKDHFLIHTVALGDREHFGANRNHDAWNRRDLIKKSHTFVTHGAYYREHRNGGPKFEIGNIKAAAYNPNHGWTELLAHGNLKPTKESSLTAEPEYERLKAGKEVDHSMSARIDYDQCEVCGKKSKSRKTYCLCMQKRAGQFDDKTQRIIAVDNIDPTFIDISSVAKRACRVARFLSWQRPDGEKVASEEIANPTGADLAAHYGMGEGSMVAMAPSFARALRKLASAETSLKTLRASQDKSVQTMARMFGSAVAFEDWTDAELKQASEVRPDRLLRKLASVNAVMPPLTFMSWFVNEPISETRKRACACEAMRMLDGLAPDIADNGFRTLSAADVSAFEPCCSSQENKGDNIDGLMESAADKFSVEGPKVNERVLKLTITIGFDKSASFGSAAVLDEAAIRDARLLAESYIAYKAATVAHLEQTRGSAFVSDFLLSTLAGQNLA